MCSANRMQPKYIYTIFLVNRFSVYLELLASLNIKIPITRKGSVCDTALNDTPTLCEFQIDVTEIWPSMKPQLPSM